MLVLLLTATPSGCKPTCISFFTVSVVLSITDTVLLSTLDTYTMWVVGFTATSDRWEASPVVTLPFFITVLFSPDIKKTVFKPLLCGYFGLVFGLTAKETGLSTTAATLALEGPIFGELAT